MEKMEKIDFNKSCKIITNFWFSRGKQQFIASANLCEHKTNSDGFCPYLLSSREVDSDNIFR